ncbi:pituitary homeobox x [Vespula squamosa]|uniref:Pituitary homeobox x n=1 Tax=Vespula squamosa TaxID=30214 RepID=A0ABD2A3K6_VESSQ
MAREHRISDRFSLWMPRYVWFKNRRAKWRKKERNALNAAAAAADFGKSGFSTASLNGFIGQPFPDPDTLYSSYSTYNNWAAKVPSPLSSKTFPWVNTLSSVVPTASHHHHHAQVSPVNCFNASTSVAGSHVSGMSVSVGQAATSMLPGMSSGLGVAGSPVAASSAACPYAAPAAPHHPYGPPVYTPHHRTAAPPETCTVMTSSSIASLRLKAKQHSSGYGGSTGGSFGGGGGGGSGGGGGGGGTTGATTGSISPVSSRASSVGGGLSACQYALTTGGGANPHSPGGPEAHATARAQKIEEERTAANLDSAATLQNEQIVSSTAGIGVGVGIGGSANATTAAATGLAGYWQHATTATSYWPSLFDCWTTPPISSGSQSLSLPRDDT